ncbi:hypothetical protein J4Q44_G00242750 [Coregonus suidteri]|uniref:Uncharacterized protein n=1 Tax=Coregonus suidteri TaxID=861788 RepID=A0AAN8QJA1_9TELE
MAESGDLFKNGNTSALMAWLFSLSVSKRGLYTTMSLLLCIFQLGLLVADVILHFVIKDNSFPSQHHTEAILLFQVVSFYWSLMGSVYSLQAGNRKMGFIALLSVFLNFVIFITRFCYELLMIQYRREQF